MRADRSLIRVLLLAAFAGALTLAAGCVFGDEAETGADDPLPSPGASNEDGVDDDAVPGDDDGDDETIADPHTLPLCEVDDARVEELLARMPLPAKIGQMYYVGVDMLPGFAGKDAIRAINELRVGAIHERILFTLGLTPRWSAKNANALQRLAFENDPPVPLLLGIDQEGGASQTLSTTTGGTDTPGNMGLGATFDPAVTADAYALMADQMRELGVNVNLAPVLEVMTSPGETSMYTRTFGGLTDWVSRHARASVSAMTARRIIATAKHFPGQTAAPGDEHTSVPVSTHTDAELRAIYLPPFIAAIEAGVPMIMPTHARFDAWDDERPPTISRAILTDLLREELGFDGVIITDDLNMFPVANVDHGDLVDLLAIEAGADMIMDIGGEPLVGGGSPGDYPTDLGERMAYIQSAVESGRVTEARIDASVRRILRMKMRYCLFEAPARDAATVDERVDTPGQREIAARLHERALTLVRDENAYLPIPAPGAPGSRVHVIAPSPLILEMYPGAPWPNLCTRSLYKAMQAIDSATTGTRFSSPLWKRRADAIVAGAAASDADVFVIGTYNARADARQADMVRRVLALGRPTIVVALAMPYDLSAFPDAPAYLAAYSNRDIAVETVARALYGWAAPQGRLPVAIPGLYPAGHSAVSKN
ncbi:glycoside hydrolase family 3 C-terminal domain-containing protein [bacterium]|nr:glycoside hydrolase family 3 C-terminal domain-containing protein [bacterium]